jgi:hypothetical protein
MATVVELDLVEPIVEETIAVVVAAKYRYVLLLERLQDSDD